MKEKKSRTISLRVTEEQRIMLKELQKASNMSQTDVLLKGLEVLGDYVAAESEKASLGEKLRELEKVALKHAEEIRKIRKKEDIIRELVKELKDIDRIIDKHQCDPSALIQILLDIQAEKRWLSKPALIWVAERLGVPLSRVMHIATFYKAFSLEPRGRHLAQVCLGTACHVRGAQQLLSKVSMALGIKPGQTDSDMKFTLKTVNCLGCCALGPVVMIDENYYSDPSVEELKRIADDLE